MFHNYRNKGRQGARSQTLRLNYFSSTLPSISNEETQLSQKEIKQIFEARCLDFGLKATPKMYERFEKQIRSNPFNKTFIMESYSLGPQSATVIKNIVLSHPKFSVIMLSGNNFGNEGAIEVAEIIKRAKGLIHVDLSSNSIGDEGISAIFGALRKNKNIYSFSIGSKTGINHNSLGLESAYALSDVLSENSVLTELDLTMVEITAESIKIIGPGLANNRFLRELNLSNNNIQSKGLIYVIPYLVKCKLRVLKLAGNHLQDDCGSVFATFIKENVSIETIDLSNNNLTSKFMSAISNALSECKTIKSLNLSKNHLGGKGASHFLTILSLNTTLESLNLQGCKIDVNGVSQLASGLKVNKALKELVLSNNTLRDEGVGNLGEGLAGQKGLKKIYLDLTEISDSGISKFLDKLSESTTIEVVSFKNNLIKDGEPISKFAEKCKSVKKICYEYNDITLPYISKIERIMRENKVRREAEKETSIVLGAKSMEDLEVNLKETRAMIKMQRDSLVDLKQGLEVAKQESEETKMQVARSIYLLEIRDQGCDRDIKKMRTEGRNLFDVIEGKIGIEKQLVDHISYAINEEMEKYKNGLSMVSSVDKEIKKINETFTDEEKELKTKLSEAKFKYKDAVYALQSAFRAAKEGPKTPEPVRDKEESAAVSSKKKKSSRKKKKGKVKK